INSGPANPIWNVSRRKRNRSARCRNWTASSARHRLIDAEDARLDGFGSTSIPHLLRVEADAPAPLPIGEGRDFRRLDFAAPAPEYIRVTHPYAAFLKVLINRGFMREHHFLVRPVRDAHDVDAAKLRAAFAPISVRHDVMPAHFPARFDLAARRHGPVEQGVETRDALSRGQRFDVLEERGEAPDDLPA